MGTAHMLRGLLPILLAAALVFSCLPVPAGASEVTEGTTPPETEETYLPDQTFPPPEVAAETQPPQQTEPEESADLPDQTEAEETGSPETVPAQVIVPTIAAISYAAATAEGTCGITIQGTVVYSGYGITVVQDQTGGICLTFPDGISAAPGLVVRVTGNRTAEGMEVTGWETRGTAALPEEEAIIGSIPACKRVVIKKAAFRSGFLIQGAANIPMTPAAPEGVSHGDTVNVWGVMVDNWFYADTVTLAEPETEQLPSVTATPLNGQLLPGENVALHCSTEGAAIYYSYSYDGIFYSDFALYSGGVPVDGSKAGIYVRAYGVTPAGTAGAQTEFYFTWERQEASGSSTEAPAQWNLYFGQLHAHTSHSDGLGTVEEAFAYASGVEGLDFFAVTDHSNSFDNDDAGSLLTDGRAVSQEWAAGKLAAAAVTNGNFVGLYGYEMTWPDMKQLGHINTFNTPGWQSTTQAGFSALEGYYQALTTAPDSISQFNHPGTEYGYFENFAHYDARYDAVIQLLEVGSGDNRRAYGHYTRALDAGWHVAPTNNQANHAGCWGDESSVRTVVLAKSLTEANLYDAMRHYRVYATEDSDLEILYYLNGSVMGSTLSDSAHTASVTFRDPTDTAIQTVEVIADGGVTVTKQENVSANETLTIPVPGGYGYYYLRVTQSDGDMAVTAPVWVVQPSDVELGSFTADAAAPVTGQEVQLTLTLLNRENTALTVDKLEITMNGQSVHSVSAPGVIPALDSFSYSVPFLYNGLGSVELKASVSISGMDEPLEETLTLRYQAEPAEVSLCTIAYAREGTAGQAFRVKGYVTAGTSNPYTTFPGMIYLQDGTGGIAVASFTDSGIQVGAPMELTGYLTRQDGNPVLELLSYELLDQDYHRYTPVSLTNQAAMDLDAYGGQLLQIEGQVLSLTRTADGKGVSRFTIKDTQGTPATVRIDDAILSGTYGVNQLTAQVIAGCWVRAIGILHREADGTLVLRVRNCDEVTYLSASSAMGAVADPSNPKTGAQKFSAPFGAGIPTPLLMAVLGITAAGLWALYRMKKQVGRK